MRTKARRPSSRRSCPPASRRRRSRRSRACSCRPGAAAGALGPVLAVIAALTMIVGTVVGVVQTNIKRMLAYSSIAHAGYLLVGDRRRQPRRQGRHPLLPAGVRRVEPRRARHRRAARHRPERARRAARLRGAEYSRPALAALMTVFLLSLGGFPPSPASSASGRSSPRRSRGHYWLAIIGVLTSVVSVFFYLRIVVMMWMTEGPEVARVSRPGGRRPGAGDDCGLLPWRPADPDPAARAGLDPDDLLGWVTGLTWSRPRRNCEPRRTGAVGPAGNPRRSLRIRRRTASVASSSGATVRRSSTTRSS